MNGNPSFDGFDIEKIASASNLSSSVNQQSQGVAALLVMLAVLLFIFAYCCWGAPFCRNLCKKYCCCQLEDPDTVDVSQYSVSNNDERSRIVATPTIILLPHGRMLVVDSNVFNQFQADNTGLDLVELSEHAIQNQMMMMNNNNPRIINRHQLQSSHGSILTTDESPSKDSSDNRFPPPTYESIYGEKEDGSVPPSYSDILLHRFATLPYDINVIENYNESKEELEMQSLESESCHHIIQNPINNFYSMANNYSSQSIACATRNSPNFDGYFLNSQLSHNNYQENSYSSLNINNITLNSMEELENTTTNNEENNFQNRVENTRNIARDNHESNFNLEFQNSDNNIDSTIDSEESRDFQLLPDIRESRV